MTTQSSSTRIRRGLGAAMTLALGLTLGACGDADSPDAPTTPPAAPTTAAPTTAASTTAATQTEAAPATTEALETTSEPATTEEPTSEEPGEETTEPDEQVRDIWAPVEDDGDPSNGAEAGPEIETTKDYLLALVANEFEDAAGYLSEESSSLLLGAEQDPAYLGQEIWLEGLRVDLTSEMAKTGETRWSSYPAWEGADEGTRVVTVRGPRADGSEFYHAVGAREVDGEWVIDQDRLDTGTGAPWVLFLNPPYSDPYRRGEPISFSVAGGEAEQSDVTLRAMGMAEPSPLEASPIEARVVYTDASPAHPGPPGSYVALVTGQSVGDGLDGMVRAHAVAFGISVDDGQR